MSMRSFGLLEDGRSVEAITLGGPDSINVEVLTYGAILRQLSIPVRGERRNLVLGFDRLEQYERDRSYMGPVVGRFGNRIAQGRFQIDGQAHQLTPNENGNHVHGGTLGVGKRLWRVLEAGNARVRLGLRSPAGEEGYPGNLDITLELSVTRNCLRAEFGASTDAPTPVNLTWHPYFNLGGEATGHWLRIPASRYLPVDAGLIPTGEMTPVSGTAFDFRRLRSPLTGGFDHCWVLDEGADCCCELRSPNRDLTLLLRGDHPGLQFYSGHGGGLILEPQGLPDAPNHAHFPNSILRPGERYHAGIEYQISV